MKYQETVIYDKVWLNEGKAYDERTGIFTATVDGIYAFSWTTFSFPEKYFVTEIVVNGKAMSYSQCDGRGQSGYPNSSNQVNIKMKKGTRSGYEPGVITEFMPMVKIGAVFLDISSNDSHENNSYEEENSRPCIFKHLETLRNKM